MFFRCSLVSDIDLDEDSVSPKSESPQDVTSETDGDETTRNKDFCVASHDSQNPTKTQQILSNISNISSSSSAEDDDGLYSLTQNIANNNEVDFDVSVTRVSNTLITPWNPEANTTTATRRRRKLPEIPKNKKCEFFSMV